MASRQRTSSTECNFTTLQCDMRLRMDTSLSRLCRSLRFSLLVLISLMATTS